MRRATAVVLAAALCACAGAPVRRVGVRGEGEPWFPRGEGRAIEYVGEIRVPANLGIERGFFARAWRWITGVEESEALYRPFGVAVSADGRLAVADPGRRAVHVYRPGTGDYRRLVRGEGGDLRYPVGVAFAGERLVVSDSEGGRLVAFDAEGGPAPLPFAVPALERPTGIAFDAQRGRLFVADTAAHVVWLLSTGGEPPVRVGERGPAPGEFNFPTHVAVDGAGSLYVCDAMNFRVQVFGADLAPAGVIGQLGDGLGDFAKPKGVAVDRDGHVFVVEGLYDVVQAFARDGTLLGVFGGTGTTPGRFWLPAGAAVDASNRLYVADTFNSRVQVFDLEGRAP